MKQQRHPINIGPICAEVAVAGDGKWYVTDQDGVRTTFKLCLQTVEFLGLKAGQVVIGPVRVTVGLVR